MTGKTMGAALLGLVLVATVANAVTLIGVSGYRAEIASTLAGATGPAGPPGTTGPTGTAGAKGTAGPAGPRGAAGPAGPRGVRGPAGATGAIGPRGVQGPKGDTGPRGPAGPSGGPGPAGQDGLSIQAGTASCTAPPGHLIQRVVIRVTAAGVVELGCVFVTAHTPYP